MKNFKRILSAFLSVIIVFSFVSVVGQCEGESNRSWMSEIDDKTPITAMSIPGTHDSASKNVLFSLFSKCQDKSITDQLNLGVRFFDIRLKKTDKGFAVVHGSFSCWTDMPVLSKKMYVENVIDEMKNFLDENPSETVLFMFKEDSGSYGLDFYTEFYDGFIANNGELWYTKNAVPTLGECRGKIVLLNRMKTDDTRFDDTQTGLQLEWPNYGTTEQEEFAPLPSSIDNGKTSCYVQDKFKFAPKKKNASIKTYLDEQKKMTNVNICFTSSAFFGMPILNALLVNGTVEKTIDNYDYLGIFCSDFMEKSLVDKIIAKNF